MAVWGSFSITGGTALHSELRHERSGESTVGLDEPALVRGLSFLLDVVWPQLASPTANAFRGAAGWHTDLMWGFCMGWANSRAAAAPRPRRLPLGCPGSAHPRNAHNASACAEGRGGEWQLAY